MTRGERKGVVMQIKRILKDGKIKPNITMEKC